MIYGTPRRILQIVTVVLVSLGAVGLTFFEVIVPFLYAPFMYSSVTAPMRVLQFYVIERIVPWYALGILFIAFGIFGRGFCGWACPFGLFQDILHVFQEIDLPSSVHRMMNHVKYGVLVGILAVCYYLGSPFFDKINPFATLVSAIPRWLLIGFMVDRWVIIRLTFFFLLIISFLFIHRFWCRYLCPVGAIAALFNKISALHIHLNASRCTKCEECLDVCPTRVNIFDVVRKRPTECILCGKCADVCSQGALELTFTEKKITEPLPSGERQVSSAYPVPPSQYTKRAYPRPEKKPLSDISVRKLRTVRGRIIFFYEDETLIPPYIKEIQTLQNFQVWLVNMQESINLVEHYRLEEPTVFVNGRVYTGPMDEDAFVAHLYSEYAMLKQLSLVFDTSKCRPCRTRECMNICNQIDITFESKIEVHSLTQMDCFACGECIVACKRGGVGLAYGEPKIDFTLNLPHLESLQDKLLEVTPMTVKAFVERDSVHCNKAITMLAAISHLSRGKINFELIDALEEPERSKAHNITVLPTLLVGQFRTFGVPTEGSLILLIRRNSRWKT
jgi:NapH/MauN family ferredoxin-type protein